MAKVIASESLSNTIGLTQCADGWWLYDETRGMNLAMRAASRESALFKALEYYQNRLATVEAEHNALSQKVDAFVSQFIEDDTPDDH